jgi:hypothetical protein
MLPANMGKTVNKAIPAPKKSNVIPMKKPKKSIKTYIPQAANVTTAVKNQQSARDKKFFLKVFLLAFNTWDPPFKKPNQPISVIAECTQFSFANYDIS